MEKNSLSERYNIDVLSSIYRQAKPEIWRELGWMTSDLNNLLDDESNERFDYLITATTVFLRSGNFGVAVRDEVHVSVKIAEASCAEQGLKLPPHYKTWNWN